jgi:hypothetical protein
MTKRKSALEYSLHSSSSAWPEIDDICCKWHWFLLKLLFFFWSFSLFLVFWWFCFFVFGFCFWSLSSLLDPLQWIMWASVIARSHLLKDFVLFYLAILKDHVLEGVLICHDDMCLLSLIVAFDLWIRLQSSYQITLISHSANIFLLFLAVFLAFCEKFLVFDNWIWMNERNWIIYL